MSIKRLLLISTVTAFMTLSYGAAAATAENTQPEDVKTYTSLADLLSIEVPIGDDQVLKQIATIFADTPNSGANLQVKRKKIRILSLRDAAMMALRKNLNIKLGRENADRIRHAIQEAEAVFDPVFKVSAGYDQLQKYSRSRFGIINLRRLNSGPFTGLDLTTDNNPLPTPGPGVIILPALASKSTPQIDSIAFYWTVLGNSFSTLKPGYCDVQQGLLCARNVPASQSDPNGPTKTWNLDLEVDQQLPWGPSFSISTVTTDKNHYYDSLGHSYDRDWATSLLLNVNIPVPGGKDFGPNAPADVAIKLSKKAAERADWDLRSVINATLVNTNTSYWELVRALENLVIVAQNRGLMEKQQERTDRFYSKGLTTAYGKAQVDAEVARLKTIEEAAKVNVVTASNNLSVQLVQSGEAANPYLFLPRDFAPLLQKLLVVDKGNAVADGLKNRPDLAAEKVSKQASEISLAYAKHQLKPDLNVNASLGLQQDASTVGYRDFFDSMSALGSTPDSATQSVTATYNRPWGNRSLKAAYTIAQKSDENQGLTVRSLENDIVQQVNDALATVLGARARIDLAEKNVEFAQAAYDKLAKRRDTGGDVRELELITKSQDLLTAKSTRINALIDNKVAESQLLAAEGIIASTYGDLTARNDFERTRLKRLSDLFPFQFFSQLLGRAKDDANRPVTKRD
jgi:outer membrane protein TolC